MSQRQPGSDRYYESLCFDLDFAWQQEIVECNAPVQFLSGGRGLGKTSCIARVKLLKHALENIDGEYAFYAPSYEVSLGEKNRLLRDPVIRTNITDHGNQPTPFLRFCSGSIIRYRSTVLEDNLLGKHYNGIILDEIQAHTERLIDNFIFPTLTAKRGWFLGMGQFDIHGVDGFIYKRFYTPGQQPNQDRYRSWIVPSSMGVMYSSEQGKEELAAIQASTDPLTFKRQYLAEPVECANLAFRKADLKACTAGGVVEKPQPGAPVIMAIDIGRTCDPSAWVCCHPMSKEKMIVLNCGLRPLGEEYASQVIAIERVRSVYAARTVIVDSTGGGAGGHPVAKGVVPTDVFAGYFKKGVSHCSPFYFTRKTKSQLMQQLQLAFEQRRIFIPEQLGVLHQQLAQYAWQLNRGFIDFAGPGGHNDDLVAALAMAWNACLLGRFSTGESVGAGIDSVLM